MSKKYMMIITHSTDEPHRTCTALGLASCLMLEGADMALFFMCEWAKMVQKGVEETIEGQNIAPVLDSFEIINLGGNFNGKTLWQYSNTP